MSGDDGAGERGRAVGGLRGRNPGRGLLAILFYEACWRIFWAWWRVVWRVEVRGAERVPASGGLLIVANHQSHLDPVSLGMALPGRHVTFIAKSGLFGVPLFGRVISLLNAVPLRQDAPDAQAIRTAVELLGQGRAVLIFPEGSRTPDGAMHPFKRGAWLVLSRAARAGAGVVRGGGLRVLPMAVEGTFDTMRRGRLPRLIGPKIMVGVGEPIDAGELLGLGAEAGLERLAATIEGLRLELSAELRAKGYELSTGPRSAAELDAEGLVGQAPVAKGGGR